MAHLLQRLAGVVSHLRRRVASAAGDPAPHRSVYYIGGLEPNFQRVRDASIGAWESYDPQPIDHGLVLFKAAVGDPQACDPVAIWRRPTPKLTVVPLTGSHFTMIRKPLVKDTATAVARFLS
jgi:thioesterase domain-containing protein